MWLFLGVLGLSVTVAFIGRLLPPKRKPEPVEPEPELEEMFWSREYKETYKGCLAYAERVAEQLYQK